MDTVLGLALTQTTVGWVMADGLAEDFSTVSGDEFVVDHGGPGLDAVSMAASVSAVATRARTMAAARGDRLHGVAVSWSDNASVAAALLLEALTDAGFENVVPVRFSEAAASLTAGVGHRGDRTAVCVIEPGLATLVLLDSFGDEEPIVTACPVGGTDDVISWLTGAIASGAYRPDVLMVAGSMRGMDRLGRRLESALKLPVFVQGGAQQALAHGAALALAPHTDLTGPPIEVTAGPGAGPRRTMSLSYAGALTMLAGGAVTLVASLSAALSLQLSPSKQVPEVRPSERVTVARVVVPAAPPPPAAPAPRDEMPPASEGAPAEFGSLWDAQAVAPGPPPPGPPSLVDRVRQHIPRLPGR